MINGIKISILWLVILIGLMIHSSLELIPLFFGESIVVPDATGSCPQWVKWMMLVVHLLPMIVIVCLQLTEAIWLKRSNFFLSLLFTIMNASHPFELVGVEPFPWHQAVLMVFLLVVSIILNIISYKWLKGSY